MTDADKLWVWKLARVIVWTIVAHCKSSAIAEYALEHIDTVGMNMRDGSLESWRESQ